MITRNASQKKAIAHLSGPMMVLAGPGSGKTSVIVERTEYLICKAKVPPSSILVVTFSKAAAKEMKERFLKHTDGKYRGVTFGTFHGIFYTILKCAYGLNADNILSEEERYSYLRELLEEHGGEMLEDRDFIEEIAREISSVKGNRIALEHYYSKSCPDEVFRKIYEGYLVKCKQQKRLDFDDMLVYCYELLSKRSDILKLWQNKFQFILVDEFQDINKIQYDTLRMLAKPKNNLFIVGDDDQSIYHFRGARPEIMLNFQKDYPDAQSVILNINYRCSNHILKSAMQLIGNNKKRFMKELKTPNEDGKKVTVKRLETLHEESLYVVREIEKQREKGIDLKNTAVLLRTNLEAESLIGLFMEYNIPFFMKERLPNIFEHWIAKDLLAYMELAKGNWNRSNFLKIMNRPNRYIAREALTDRIISLEALEEYYADKDWMCERILELKTHLRVLEFLNPFAAINYIRKGIAYEEYLQEYAEYRRIRLEELQDILDRLQESARGMQSLEEWKEYMSNYKEKLKEQAKKQLQPQGVTITTMHGAKGLEYDFVYILNVNEGNIPYKKAVLDAQIEEERRLFYVGMTRAKKELTLCYTTRQFDKEKEASRFLEEITYA